MTKHAAAGDTALARAALPARGRADDLEHAAPDVLQRAPESSANNATTF